MTISEPETRYWSECDGQLLDIELDVETGPKSGQAIIQEKDDHARDTASTQSTTSDFFMDPKSRPVTIAPESTTGPSFKPPTTGIATLSRISSRISLSHSSRSIHQHDPGPPPDGGLTAWTQAICAHFVVASAWGFATSFGSFQTYYTSQLSVPQSTISWIGSSQITLLFLVGIGSGRATDAGYFHSVFAAGVVFQVIGVITMSVSTTFYQLLFSQGICVGIGSGLLFTPTMALLSTYFSTKRNFAMGIASVGSCTGGLVFPAIARQLIPRIGFGWSVRIIGFIMLAFNLFAAAFLRLRLPPRKSGPLVEWSAFKEAPYSFFVAAMFFVYWSLYFAFFYVGTFSRNVIGFNYSDSVNLLLVMVGVGVPGRLLPGLIADKKIGPLNCLIPFCLLCGVMFFAWIGIDKSASLYVFAAFYGTGSAGIQSLFPPALSSLTQDLSTAGTRLGMGFFVVSFAVLTGTPIAGALIAADGGSYLYAQCWAGCSMAIGVCLLIAARLSKTGCVFRKRV